MADGNIKQIKLPNNKIYNLHDARVDNLPNPMVFKGTLGSGGTISSLPAASTTNEGWTYKVITDGTYAGETAKIGDAFISNGTKWELIPSGDEPSGTVTNVATGTGLTGGPITTSGTISHATGAGYNHIPSGGSSGQILRWSADGTAVWGEDTAQGGGLHISDTAPNDTGLLWIDTSLGGVIKYYYSNAWVAAKSVWG